MKYKFLAPIIILSVLMPLAVYAFSFTNWFWGVSTLTQSAGPAPELTAAQKKAVEAKYNAWETAYEKKHDITPLLKDKNNFIFTEAEINYLITRELTAAKNPAFNNVKVELDDDLVKFSGYCLDKPFTGDITAQGTVVSDGNEIKAAITGVTWRGWPLPKFIANGLINKNDGDFLKFLYSYPNYKGMDVVIKNKQIEVIYR